MATQSMTPQQPALARLLGVQPPDAQVPHWHISPAVDLMAYAFGWAWVLIPLLLMGPDRHADYLYLYMFAIVVTDLHRHYGLPYVYLDSQVTSRYPLRFFLFPLVMFAAFAASPYLRELSVPVPIDGVLGLVAWVLVLVQVLRRDQNDVPVPWRHLAWSLGPVAGGLGLAVLASLGGVGLPSAGLLGLMGALVASAVLDWCMLTDEARPFQPRFIIPGLVLALVVVAVVFGPGLQASVPRGGLPVRNVINGIVVFAVVWNIWHVYMQKYGILRLYNAKNGLKEKVPGWVDRLLIFSWLPLYIAWLTPRHGDLIRENFKKGAQMLNPALALFEDMAPVLLPISAALVVGAVAAFIYYERKVNGLRNHPRLWMAGGTTLLSACFLFVDPVKAYIAYGFGHAIEYMVFVWAYQRRRYQAPLEHKPLLGRLLRHPAVAYLGFVLVLGGIFFYLKYWGRYTFSEYERPMFLDFKASTWFFFWTVYQSMVHFYFDGFLWKMRLPTTRAHI